MAATTVDTRSPVSTFRLTPLVKHSPMCVKDHEARLSTRQDIRQKEKNKVRVKRLPLKKEDKDAGNKRSKKSKNKDMPKRPASAFILFMSSVKEELKKQNPDIKTAVMLSKSAGTKWKSMAAEDKLPYIKLAAEEKAAYQTKLESYRSMQSAEDKENQAAYDESDSSVLPSTDLNILEGVGDSGIDIQRISASSLL